MSISIPIDKLTNNMIKKLEKDMEIEIKQNSMYSMGCAPKYIYPYTVYNKKIYLPFYYCSETLGIKPKLRRDCKTISVKYNENYPLRDEQRIVKSEALGYLNDIGCCVLSLHTGFGKTCLSIYLACKLGLKTLYINNRLTIIDQLVDSITKFTNGKVQLITPKSELDEDADFYVINAINVHKMGYEFFKDISILCIDECHCIVAEVLSECLRYIEPKYLIGLSATPYRNDGMDILLDLYFGKDRISRKLNRSHKVYIVDSGFKPENKLNKFGKIDWNHIINQQANDTKRNEIIIKIIKLYPSRVFLVLCKRVDQVKYIEKRLLEEGETVSALYGNKRKYDKNNRIIVGTSGKIGIGFDNQRLDTLLLAADVEDYFIQILGRIFRTPDVVPIIFDIVDTHPVLHRHWNTRKKVYVEHGGVVEKLRLK